MAVAVHLVLQELLLHVLGVDAGLAADPDSDDEVVAEGLDRQDEPFVDFGDEVLDVVLGKVFRDAERSLNDVTSEVQIDAADLATVVRRR